MLTPEKMNRLQAVKNGRSMASTTTFNGNRNRYTSGIFLPKIPFTNGSGLLGFIRLSIELAVRATRRNKTGNRANNAGWLMAVVEPLLHPLPSQSVQQAPFTKTIRGHFMLYTFQFIRSKIRVTVGASSYEEARAKFADPVIFCYRKKGDVYA